jgi:hypothetical protein
MIQFTRSMMQFERDNYCSLSYKDLKRREIISQIIRFPGKGIPLPIQVRSSISIRCSQISGPPYVAANDEKVPAGTRRYRQVSTCIPSHILHELINLRAGTNPFGSFPVDKVKEPSGDMQSDHLSLYCESLRGQIRPY